MNTSDIYEENYITCFTFCSAKMLDKNLNGFRLRMSVTCTYIYNYIYNVLVDDLYIKLCNISYAMFNVEHLHNCRLSLSIIHTRLYY